MGVEKDEICKVPGLGDALQEGLALQAFITFKIFQCHHEGPVLIVLGTGLLGSLGVSQPGLL